MNTVINVFFYDRARAQLSMIAMLYVPGYRSHQSGEDEEGL
jgi:hypothetical protein